MPLRNLILILLTVVVSYACYDRADRNRYASTVAQAMDVINENYLEAVNYRDLYENAMEGMAGGLDPYSGYIPPNDYGYFTQQLEQEFGGIGILVEFGRETRRPTVTSPLVDTPAARAGVRAGDIILAIDGLDTADISFRETVQMIRGKPGDIVRLMVLHVGEDEPVELEIERAIIPVESVLGDVRWDDGSWDFRLEHEPRITYIRLVTFGDDTVDELERALRDANAEALVLDLRDNAGGLLTAAVGVCDLFLDEGMIVSIRGRDGEIRDRSEANPNSVIGSDVPMAVLVNGFSASASEIVAACLQDHGRAKVVGQRTWGKGTVQNVIELEGGSAAIKLTTASYWRPSGENIHRMSDADDSDQWGVIPDEGFEVTLTDEQADEIRKVRQQRDTVILMDNGDPAPSDPSASKHRPDDPQLRRAIDYLLEALPPDGTEDRATAA
jgi:carboxyl-terminal processing protease